MSNLRFQKGVITDARWHPFMGHDPKNGKEAIVIDVDLEDGEKAIVTCWLVPENDDTYEKFRTWGINPDRYRYDEDLARALIGKTGNFLQPEGNRKWYACRQPGPPASERPYHRRLSKAMQRFVDRHQPTAGKPRK